MDSLKYYSLLEVWFFRNSVKYLRLWFFDNFFAKDFTSNIYYIYIGSKYHIRRLLNFSSIENLSLNYVNTHKFSLKEKRAFHAQLCRLFMQDKGLARKGA